MTSILLELEAQYATRAAQAQMAPPAIVETAPKPRATRTYTGAALERRRAWGRSWGAIVREHAKELT